MIYQAILLGKSYDVRNWEKKGLTWKVINIPINHNFTYRHLLRWLNRIYLENKEGFKLSLGFGFVLFQPIKKEYKYYYVSENNMLFDKSYTIASKKDIEAFVKKVIGVDLATNCYLQKPSSGWTLCSLTNAQAKITNLNNVLQGAGISPEYLRNLKSVICLTHNRGVPYEDELCIYRCLALHHSLPVKALEKIRQNFMSKI